MFANLNQCCVEIFNRDDKDFTDLGLQILLSFFSLWTLCALWLIIFIHEFLTDYTDYMNYTDFLFLCVLCEVFSVFFVVNCLLQNSLHALCLFTPKNCEFEFFK